MKRDRLSYLIDWLNSSTRKPLVIRGARQVGKTWVVRALAASQKKQLVEINFEKTPDLTSLFSSNDPKEILINISSYLGYKIDPPQSLLFLDEIQVVPELLGKLRWFAEEMPQLPIVAAGSLLDFALNESRFSMPVGRISYLYLEPLSFEEFLEGINQHEIRLFLENYHWDMTIPQAIHNKLIRYIREYLIIGGMPEAVSSWSEEKNPETVNQIHFDLLTTYRDDFAKYSGRIATQRLDEVLKAIPQQLGKKFMYKEVNPNTNAQSLKQSLELLAQARVCHRIISTASNGLPLGAEINEKFMKVILVDCGLCSASLGLSLHRIQEISEMTMINNGGLAEQFVGQNLRTISPPFIPPSLYYWQRAKKGADAEVDYIIQHEHQIIPIEVKAGTFGTLKSLHQFMKEKKKKIAMRINSDIPKISSIRIKDFSATEIEYVLLSIPFYLIGQIHRLISEAESQRTV